MPATGCPTARESDLAPPAPPAPLEPPTALTPLKPPTPGTPGTPAAAPTPGTPSTGTPISASMTMAQSSTVHVKGPGISSDQQLGRIPRVDRRPGVGIRPTVPVAEAGRRTEPVVSEPSANMAVPAATDVPAPVEEPPVKRSVSQGFRAGGKGRSKYSPPLPVPNSQVASLPIRTAPADLSCATRAASPSGT